MSTAMVKRGRKPLVTGFTAYSSGTLDEFRREVATRAAAQKAALADAAIGMARSGKGNMSKLKAAADECQETELLLETVVLVMEDLGYRGGTFR